MNLILLSGNNKSNQQWIQEVEQTLKPLFEKTYIQKYRHWETDADIIDLDFELAELAKVASTFGEYSIFAKSAGVLLTLQGISEGVLNPKHCFFCGFPHSWAKMNNFAVDTWIRELSVPTLFIQKSHDPAMFYEDLVEYLTEKEDLIGYKTVELPGNDHNYNDLAKVKDLITDFVSKF